MNNILIIGCGLLGSSLLRRIHKKKIVKKIFIYEKSKSNVSKIKKLRLPGIVIDNLDKGAINYDLIIVCTPMSEYKNLILKINNFITPKTLITDVGSSKIETSKFIGKSVKHNLLYAKKLKKFLEVYNISSNKISANFLFLNFDNCKISAKYLYEKLKQKGVILRSTQDGYGIKNKLRLTIGSKEENLKFMNTLKRILN